MEMEKKNLLYLLGNYHFVVPEIQREYVWGATKNNRVLVQFLSDLNDKLGKGNANIGFLYSYQSGSEHYLIDGQQRYTTMILLLFYLSHMESMSDDFRKLMKPDMPHPAFSYRVRTYTESFLAHLLTSDATNEKQVRDQKWFKNEYLKDTTIVSMLGALEVFEANVRRMLNLTYRKVMESVCFWYFDVEQTSQGEELYITMNSRGEKLTDSEQIKPRLLNHISVEQDKQRYGKEWDNWEDFFYQENLRGSRPVQTINDAMDNVVRLVLELKTQSEHDRIKPVEDAELITVEDIKICMDAVISLLQLGDSRFLDEVKRLYGDSKGDGNFYVLKALLTEQLKRQSSAAEYERVYQTILNQVRRNKIKRHKDFLSFLSSYRNSDLSFYDFILNTDSIQNKNIINGHELDKVVICHDKGADAEAVIWREQSNPFWNGDIRQLMTWSIVDGQFCLAEFERVCRNFNILFDKTENVGWTTDNVRQALITRRLPNYPLDSWMFGYEASQWRVIFHDNQEEMKCFLDMFDNADATRRDEIIADMKAGYPETQENKWAEFVHHDYLLAYCNKKRIQWREQYGIECLQNYRKKPYSVMNMHLYHYLQEHLSELQEVSEGWQLWEDQAHWKTVIVLWKSNAAYSLRLQYRKDHDSQYEIVFCVAEETDQKAWQQVALAKGFVEQDEVCRRYVAGSPDSVLQVLKQLVTISRL